jgi:hypothetical protein
MTAVPEMSYCRTDASREIGDKVFGMMERETGLEPATSSLGNWAIVCFQ